MVHSGGGAHGIDASLHGVVEDALGEEHQGMHGLVLGSAATYPCTVRSVRNDAIVGSAGTRSARDRMPWKRTHRTIHPT